MASQASPGFGALLQQHRLAAGWTQEELAERSGLSSRGIAALELGERRQPHQLTVKLLADALQLAPEERAHFEAAAGRAGRRSNGSSGRWPVQMTTATRRVAQSNLPLQLTTFIGRERDLAGVQRLVDQSRLVTITGPAGSGKTRLALQAAERMVDAFRDGVWLVELARVRDPLLVTSAVAAPLGIREEPASPLLSTLMAHLRDRHLLVLLDNCEHLIDACAEVVLALLRQCADVRVLTTSRERLKIPGEATWRVAPLSLPVAGGEDGPEHAGRNGENAPGRAGRGPAGKLTVEDVWQAEAVRLFVDRARAGQPEFLLTDENQESVIQICRQLDGLPLALELAAACLPALSVEQIAARLTDRFRLLTRGGRGSAERQRTLAAAIDWSYALLSRDEQRLLARLSVFAGGWTLEAAEAIGGGDGTDGPAVFDVLAELVEKSLVQVEERGHEVRYRLLETIREYATERLEESGEAEQVRHVHGAYMLALAQAALPDEHTGAIPYPALDRLEREHDNLRAALAWAEEQAPQELGLPLAVTAAQFWEIRDYYWESRQWIDRMLAKTDIGQEGGAMPEGRDTAVLKARALYFLGSSSIYLGEYETGRQRLEESLARYRMLDDRSSLILVLSVLGGYLATNAGQPAAAIPHLREAVNLARAAGPPYRLAKALRELAWALHLVGESEGGLDLLQEAIAPLRELGDEGRLGPVYQVLGAIALAIGQRRRSEEWFLDGLPRSARAKDRAYVALQLEGLAQIAAEDEQWERAARLWGAVEGLRTTIRFPIAPADWPRYERWVPKIGEHLGRADWDRLSQEGREMSVEEMVVYALRTGATLSG